MASKSATKYIEWEKESESAILKHFLREQGSTPRTAKCKLCPSILKMAGGSTKGLHTHLKKNTQN